MAPAGRKSANTIEHTRRAVVAGMAATFLPWGARAAATIYRWEPMSSQPAASITFVGGRGAKRNLSQYRGHPILLNIWATWCGPCVIELPALDRLQGDLGGTGLIVLALSLDRGGMSDVLVAHRRLGLKRLAPLVDTTGDASRALKIAGLPATFAIDANGRFIAGRRGAVQWDLAGERRQVRELLLTPARHAQATSTFRNLGDWPNG